MKPGRKRKQSGFFDAGLSLLILALAGGAIMVSEYARDRNAAAAEAQAPVAQVESPT